MGEVINMFDRKRTKVETAEKTKADFEEAAKKNKENEERRRKERQQANQSVLKNYRIK